MDGELNEFFECLEAIDVLEIPFDRALFNRTRLFHKRPDYFTNYDDVDFFRRYRLSKESALFLLEKIEHYLEYKDNINNSVPPICQLLIALRYYATGNQLLAVADIGGVSISTCSRIVKKVSEAIVTLRTEFIKFPESQEAQNKVKGDFYAIARFPNVIGCLDCTHIKIQFPGGDDAELFRNRKGYMSINVQTISTTDLAVTDVVARWAGSTHDSAIYQNSNRFRKFESGDYGRDYLLGDIGYPLKSHLLTPYLNPVNRSQQKYNEAHIKTRNVVEGQYGVQKRRFPVLAVGIKLKLNTAVNVIISCCILHNLCIMRKEAEPINENLILDMKQLIRNGQINFSLNQSDH